MRVPGRVPPYVVAGGVFIARGRPQEALELIVPYYYGVERVIPTKEGGIPYGDSWPLLKRVKY